MQLYPTLFCGIAQIYAAIYSSLFHHMLSAVSYDPLSHSRHNPGDRRAKVGNEISCL